MHYFSTGFSYGLTPVVGEFYGNRRFMEAGQALRSSLLANVLVALLLTLIMTVVYFCVEYMGHRGTDSLDKTLFSGSTCIPGICHAVQWL